MPTNLYTVTIVMSTYNGEKYIKEQIESLLAQEDIDIKISIRDDGSKDRTLEIINEFRDDRIKVVVGENNLGPAQSFLKMLRECEKSHYYAYCDQDDVWKPRKLIEAIKKINETDNQKAILYMSTYEVVDSQLNVLFVRNMEFEKPFRLQDTIIHRAPSACTMVFNHALREVICQSHPQYVRMHDYWTLLIAEAFHFRIVVDDKAQILYRQHGDNSVSVTPSIFTRVKRLLKSAKKGNNERWRQACELYKAYQEQLPEDSAEILSLVLKYRFSIPNRLRLLRNKQFKSGDLYHDTLFKIAVIMGKF